MSTVTQVSAVLKTDTGMVRDHNEDYVSAWEPSSEEEKASHGWLYLVADGVGGAEAGEVASRVTVEQVTTYYLADHETQEVGERLQAAIRAANDDLRQLAANQHHANMATTLVAVAIVNNQATIANVGDSRCYHWRQGQIRQITKDQSLVAQLVEEGAITEEEALNHPRRNVILFSIGSMRDPRIDLFTVSLEPDDLLLLCSDGLTRHVSDPEIAETLGQTTPELAGQMLVELANARGGSDNISVALISFGQHTPVARVVTAPMRPFVLPAGATPYALWAYALFLAVVEVILILVIWFGLRV